MKVYKLTINEVENLTGRGAIISSYRAERQEKKVEYYATRELADKRKVEIAEGMLKLVGFFPHVEAVVSEIEVIDQ